MANEKRLIYANDLEVSIKSVKEKLSDGSDWIVGYACGLGGALDAIKEMPTIDAVVMPKGKPGDFLEWDNGTGFKQIYCIHSVMICEDCMRYELANFTPVVNHPNIVRIMSKEEAEKEWKERCARERAEEEPTLTACPANMDGGAEDGK